MKDIFKGEWFNIWEDRRFVHISLGNVTVSFPLSEWEEIKEEMRTI